MKIFKVCYEYRTKGVTEWISGSNTVLAKDAETAIKMARKDTIGFVVIDVPEFGKNKGKEIEYKITHFRLESVELLAEADLV